jgi:hypothetical protein
MKLDETLQIVAKGKNASSREKKEKSRKHTKELQQGE